MRIRVAVIGLGNIGIAHTRIYRQLKECELVALCDIDPHKKHVAEKYKCPFFQDAEDLLSRNFDAVSVCTPTSTHQSISLEALQENKHILVEKPLAKTVKEAEKLVNLGKSQILAVGHVERFNPALQKLKEVADLCDIYSTISLRFGPYPPRTKDIGVLLDLGSHEIDMLNYLTRETPEVIHASMSNNLNRNGFEDYACISLKYGHMHGHIEVSWLPTYKLRQMNLYGENDFYSLDYAQQKLMHHRGPPRAKFESGSWQDILWLSRNVNEEIQVSAEEPLKLELKVFIESVQKGQVLHPLCSGQEGLEVLKILESARNRR